MKIYNNYILAVAIALLVTTIILAATGQHPLDLYYTLYIIEAFIVTELYIHFSAKAKRGLNQISLILFGGFLAVVALQVIKIVTPNVL